MIDKIIEVVFWIGTATLGIFLILFVYLVFYLLTLGIISVFYLLQ